MRSDIGESRTRILHAAVGVFYSQGFEEATFRQIADEVGISQPAIYKHFTNKMNLLVNCSKLIAQKAQVQVDKQIDLNARAHERLKSYIAGHFEWLQKSPKEAACVLSLYFFAATHHEALLTYRQMEKAACDRIHTHLAQGNYESSWKINDIEITARLIHSLLVGELIKYLHTPKQPPAKKAAEHTWKCIFKVLESAPAKK